MTEYLFVAMLYHLSNWHKKENEECGQFRVCVWGVGVKCDHDMRKQYQTINLCRKWTCLLSHYYHHQRWEACSTLFFLNNDHDNHDSLCEKKKYPRGDYYYCDYFSTVIIVVFLLHRHQLKTWPEVVLCLIANYQSLSINITRVHQVFNVVPCRTYMQEYKSWLLKEKTMTENMMIVMMIIS